jgi:2-iminobutanoate/2-iminopropanoate deaminase
MEKEIIKTPNAPAPIGPYSQAVKQGNFIFISGQIPLNPQSGEMMNQDFKSEAMQVMENLMAILESANASFSHVVKTTIFLTDFKDFAAANEIYGSFFTGDFPARETVQVSALPRNARIEISMIAMV